MEQHQSELVAVLTDLRSQLKKQTSLKFALLRGMVYGVGTVVGATILIALGGWIISIIFDNPENVPIVQDVIEEQREL